MRRIVIQALWVTGATRWFRERLRKENAVVVLMLHRVLSDADKAETNSEPTMIVGDGAYAAMIEHIQRNYRLVDVCAPEIEFSGDKPGLALTFDDGWIDNFEALLRGKRERNVPATVFISPTLTGKVCPFWPEQVREILVEASERELVEEVEALKPLSPPERQKRIQQLARRQGRPEGKGGVVDSTMSWEQLEELRKAGISLASHTMDHEILTSLKDAALVDRQLTESKREIEQRWGVCDVLAYPNGGHDELVVNRTRAAGYHRAFTVAPGVWTPDTDPLRIPRLNITDGRVTFDGKFSPAAFEFSVAVRAYRAWRASRTSRAGAAVSAKVPAATRQHNAGD